MGVEHPQRVSPRLDQDNFFILSGTSKPSPNMGAIYPNRCFSRAHSRTTLPSGNCGTSVCQETARKKNLRGLLRAINAVNNAGQPGHFPVARKNGFLSSYPRTNTATR